MNSNRNGKGNKHPPTHQPTVLTYFQTHALPCPHTPQPSPRTHLSKDEGVEGEGADVVPGVVAPEVLRVVRVNGERVPTLVHKEQGDGQLVRRLTQNVAPHDTAAIETPPQSENTIEHTNEHRVT